MSVLSVSAEGVTYQWKVTTPAVVLPRVDHGIDHGAARILLLEAKGALVYWQLGHTGWFRVGEQKYYQAGLYLRSGDPHEYVGRPAVFTGRLTAAAILGHKGAIAEFLGLPAGALPTISRKHTLTLIGKRRHRGSA